MRQLNSMAPFGIGVVLPLITTLSRQFGPGIQPFGSKAKMDCLSASCGASVQSGLASTRLNGVRGSKPMLSATPATLCAPTVRVTAKPTVDPGPPDAAPIAIVAGCGVRVGVPGVIGTVGVFVGELAGVPVEVCVAVAFTVPLAVAVFTGVAVGVATGVGGVNVAVAVAGGVVVTVALAVGVSLAPGVAVAVSIGVAVAVDAKVSVAVGVCGEVFVAVGVVGGVLVAVAEAGGVCVAV